MITYFRKKELQNMVHNVRQCQLCDENNARSYFDGYREQVPYFPAYNARVIYKKDLKP
jgi:hypothetical protein